MKKDIDQRLLIGWTGDRLAVLEIVLLILKYHSVLTDDIARRRRRSNLRT